MALSMEPDDDIRENIVSYHDEGAGEEDMHAYDITPLRIPIGIGKEAPLIGRKPMIPSEAKLTLQQPFRGKLEKNPNKRFSVSPLSKYLKNLSFSIKLCLLGIQCKAMSFPH